MITEKWRKSSRSSQTANCVEVHATLDRMRDSKNPGGPVLLAPLGGLIAAVKADKISHGMEPTE